MRSAFSRQHFTITDLYTGLVIPDVVTIGNLVMAHKTEKVRTATPRGRAGVNDTHAGLATGVGRYVNISGNSDPNDPFFEFILSDLTLDAHAYYQLWEYECRLNQEAGHAHDFEIQWFRNEELSDVVAATIIFNARCKSYGPQGDASSNTGGDKQSIYRVELECESITHVKL